MIFKRGRGIRRESPKQDALALEPAVYSQCRYEFNGQRMFYVCLGDRTLGRGTSSHGAWSRALKVLKGEKTS